MLPCEDPHPQGTRSQLRQKNKVGAQLIHTHVSKLFVSKERSEREERKRVEECRRKIHSFQGKKLVLLKYGYDAGAL